MAAPLDMLDRLRSVMPPCIDPLSSGTYMSGVSSSERTRPRSMQIPSSSDVTLFAIDQLVMRMSGVRSN